MDHIETLRKRLIYLSQHRGTKEMDLILGDFAQKNVAEMDFNRLKKFEILLSLPDQDIQERLYRNQSLEDILNEL